MGGGRSGDNRHFPTPSPVKKQSRRAAGKQRTVSDSSPGLREVPLQGVVEKKKTRAREN